MNIYVYNQDTTLAGRVCTKEDGQESGDTTAFTLGWAKDAVRRPVKNSNDAFVHKCAFNILDYRYN